MYDVNTFLTLLYVHVDDFVARSPQVSIKRGRRAALSVSEVITINVFMQWSQFPSERAFYRWAMNHLKPYFPNLPDRSQFNRIARMYVEQTQRFAVDFARLEDRPLYQVVDGCGVAVRAVSRRGNGWLDGLTKIGLCTRLGWYNGAYLLTCVNPSGTISGFALGSANTKDQLMADAFLTQRSLPNPTVPSVGEEYKGAYVFDKGFSAPKRHKRWCEEFGIEVVCAPQRGHGKPWPKEMRRWLASIRQIVETVHDKLLNSFRLSRERPHHLSGLLTRVAAKVALHNFCIALNRKQGRRELAFADIMTW